MQKARTRTRPDTGAVVRLPTDCTVRTSEPMMDLSDLRFDFGDNWSRFLQTLNEERIARAEDSLCELTGLKRLDGLTFLDIGSGSGLSSLAARRLGAIVSSFDFDRVSVDCTKALRDRYFPNDPGWSVSEGSILDDEFLRNLGRFDVVYSWGVLHHTGRMWAALENVAALVRPNGRLIVAIYNDQGRASRAWALVKRLYNVLPPPLRFLVLWPATAWIWGPAMFRDLVTMRPLATWRNYYHTRGMSPWRDVVDWVGGYPFEVARPEAIFNFYAHKGFRLTRLATCAGGFGCNEFAFSREDVARP